MSFDGPRCSLFVVCSCCLLCVVVICSCCVVVCGLLFVLCWLMLNCCWLLVFVWCLLVVGNWLVCFCSKSVP